MRKARTPPPQKWRIISSTDHKFIGMEITLEGLIAGIVEQPFTPTSVVDIDATHKRLFNSNYSIEARKL